MKFGLQSLRGKRLGLIMEDYYEWEDIQDFFWVFFGVIVIYICVEGYEIEEYKVILFIFFGIRLCYFCVF